MKKKLLMVFTGLLLSASTISGCRQRPMQSEDIALKSENMAQKDNPGGDHKEQNKITPDTEITELEEDLSVVRFEGKYGFDEFLKLGGASSDEAVVEYLSSQLTSDIPKLMLGGNPFGCSTLSVKNTEEGYLFGRNFDWNVCKALIISSRPDNGYASVSTVNMDFIQAGGLELSDLPDMAQAIIGLYAPLMA